jgi:hypothetical protein
MNPRKAVELAEAWGNRPCEHPRVEPIGHYGMEACAQCGRVVSRDEQGQPIPGPAPSQYEVR